MASGLPSSLLAAGTKAHQFRVRRRLPAEQLVGPQKPAVVTLTSFTNDASDPSSIEVDWDRLYDALELQVGNKSTCTWVQIFNVGGRRRTTSRDAENIMGVIQAYFKLPQNLVEASKNMTEGQGVEGFGDGNLFIFLRVQGPAVEAAADPLQPTVDSETGELRPAPLATLLPEQDEQPRETSDVFLEEQVSIYFMNDAQVVVSIHETAALMDTFEKIYEKLDNPNSVIRTTFDASLFIYAITDSIVDVIFGLLEDYTEKLREIEQEMNEEPQLSLVGAAFGYVQQLKDIRMNLWRHRELITELNQDEYMALGKTTKKLLKVVYKHTENDVEIIERLLKQVSAISTLYGKKGMEDLNGSIDRLARVTIATSPILLFSSINIMKLEHQPAWWTWRWGYIVWWLFGLVLLLIPLALGLAVTLRRKRVQKIVGQKWLPALARLQARLQAGVAYDHHKAVAVRNERRNSHNPSANSSRRPSDLGPGVRRNSLGNPHSPRAAWGDPDRKSASSSPREAVPDLGNFIVPTVLPAPTKASPAPRSPGRLERQGTLGHLAGIKPLPKDTLLNLQAIQAPISVTGGFRQPQPNIQAPPSVVGKMFASEGGDAPGDAWMAPEPEDKGWDATPQEASLRPPPPVMFKNRSPAPVLQIPDTPQHQAPIAHHAVNLAAPSLFKSFPPTPPASIRPREPANQEGQGSPPVSVNLSEIAAQPVPRSPGFNKPQDAPDLPELTAQPWDAILGPHLDIGPASGVWLGEPAPGTWMGDGRGSPESDSDNSPVTGPGPASWLAHERDTEGSPLGGRMPLRFNGQSAQQQALPRLSIPEGNFFCPPSVVEKSAHPPADEVFASMRGPPARAIQPPPPPAELTSPGGSSPGVELVSSSLIQMPVSWSRGASTERLPISPSHGHAVTPSDWTPVNSPTRPVPASREGELLMPRTRLLHEASPSGGASKLSFKTFLRVLRAVKAVETAREAYPPSPSSPALSPLRQPGLESPSDPVQSSDLVWQEDATHRQQAPPGTAMASEPEQDAAAIV